MAETGEITQPIIPTATPFSESTWSTSPTVPEPLKEEKTEPTAEGKDKVIEEKDEKLKESGDSNTKPDQPDKVPAATPKPIQDRPEEDLKKPAEDKLEFANEESRKLYEAIRAGKDEEVLEILNKKQVFAKLDTLKPEEIIRLDLQQKNPTFTDDDIADLIAEKYQAPVKPDEDEYLEDEYKEKLAEYNKAVEKHERKLARDSKEVLAELSKLKPELTLPDITPPTANNTPTQEELDKGRDEFLQAALSNPIEYKATFKDEEVEIPLANYSVSNEEKESLKPLLESLYTNFPQFLQNLNWVDKDGNPNEKMQADLHLLLNKDKVIQKFVNDAGNKRYEAAIKAQKNIDLSGNVRRGSLDANAVEEGAKRVKGFLAAS